MDKYLSFVTIDFWTLIFTWCNLLILFLFMKKFLFGPISNILKQREDEIKNIYDSAKKSEDSATKKEKEYTKKLENAKLEASTIVENAVSNANLRKNEILTDAQEQAKSMISRADKQINQERENAMNSLKSDISSLSISIAEKIIEKDLTDDDHIKMVDKIIDEMGEDI